MRFPVFLCLFRRTERASSGGRLLSDITCSRFSSLISQNLQPSASSSSFELFHPPQSLIDIQAESIGDSAFGIRVKDKLLLTPSKQVLQLPSSELANLICLEWNSAPLLPKDFTHSRPITALSFRASSLFESQENRLECIDGLLRFLDTDTILFWEPSESKLKEFEKTHWQPIFDKLNKRFSFELVPNTGLTVSTQTSAVSDALRQYLLDLSPFALAATERAIHDLKSVLLGVAVSADLIPLETAIQASMLELFYQAERWGLVEDVHELEISRIRQNLILLQIFHKL